MNNTLFDALLASARNSKEHVGTEHQWLPVIVYAPDNHEPVIGNIDGENMQAELVKALSSLYSEFGSAEWIAVTGDTFSVKTTALKRELNEADGLELAERFAKGDSVVVEMMVTVLATEKRIDMAYQQYRFIPSEGWEWDEPVVTRKVKKGGGVPEIVKAFFKFQKEKNGKK